MTEALLGRAQANEAALEEADLPSAEDELQEILRVCGVSEEQLDRLDEATLEEVVAEVTHLGKCALGLTELIMEQSYKLQEAGDHEWSLPVADILFDARDYRVVTSQRLPALQGHFRPLARTQAKWIERFVVEIAHKTLETSRYVEFWRIPRYGWTIYRFADTPNELFK